MLNKTLGQKIIDLYDTNPDKLAMAFYFHPCKTAACIAGNAFLLSGYTIEWDNPDSEDPTLYDPEGRIVPRDMWFTGAQKLLGLSRDEMYGTPDSSALSALFYDRAENAIARLRKCVEND